MQAQDLQYNHQFLSVEDGLASREVLCGLQDQRGFLWFGTRNGLNRYDGKRFTLLTKRDGLQRNRIVNLAEDQAGNLWISYGIAEGTFDTDGKIDIYNPVSGELTPLEEKFPSLPFDYNEITSILPNQRGDVYLLVRNALVYRYNVVKGFERVVDASEILGKSLRNPDYTPHANGESIAFNENFSFFGNRIVTNTEPSKKLSYFNEKSLLEFVSLDKKSKVPRLIIEKHSLDGELKIEYRPCDLFTFNVFNNLDSIGARRNDKFGPAILLPLNSGLFVFKNYKFFPLLADPNLGKNFSVNMSFFSDRQGNYWVCTPQGLHKFMPSQKRFQVLFNKAAFDMQDPLGNQVRGILADATGKVWTGGHFGLVVYDKKEGKYFSKLRVADDIWIHCFDKRDNKVYFFGSGCHATDLPGMAVSRNYLLDLNLDPKAYRSTIGFIWAQYPLSEERYLLGNDHGKLLIWDIRSNHITPVETCQQAMPFSNFIYRIIFSEKDQHYWAAGGSGCYRISKDLCITDFYGTENVVDEKHRMPFSDLRDLYEDPDGIFWLATNGEGLLRWDRANGAFQSFTIQDGMPSNTLYNILPDDFGNIWVSTDNGLVRFNKTSHYINVFSAKDGIAHNEFNRISSYQGADGMMYFGGIDGLTAFHPRDFGTDTIDGQIPLQITAFNQFLGSNDQLTNLTYELLTTQEITLHPGDKFFSLEFALLDFQSPVSYYKYQIEGFDKEWQYIQEPLLRISGLPYGKYTLRIAGQSYSGAWSKQELAIPIHVLRPYYLRWWAFALYGLAFLSLLYYFREYQIRRLLEKADKLRLQEIDLLKTKLYTNITHEFRTPLTVILGMTEQLAVGSWQSAVGSEEMKVLGKSFSLIKRNGQNLLRLINQMLDLSKLDSGKMSVDWELGDVVLFLQYLSESFHSYAATKHIQLTFYPEVKSLEMDYDREKLQQIISNLLSNAVKFTPEKGKVILHVSEVPANGEADKKVLQIKISNTGIGISAEHIANIFDRFYQADNTHTRKDEGTGIGLALTKELVELLGGSISAKSEIGQGAEFTVRLPVRKSAVRSLDLPQIETAVPASGTMAELMTSAGSIVGLETDDAPLLLLIEDNADVATYIRTCLEGQYRMLWAEDGQSGIDKALETIPDIIISDVMMPEKDGYEVTHFLKNDERTSHIPIVLLTAKAEVESRLEGLGVGADAYLAKPFLKEELFIWLQKLVELRRKLQQKYAGRDFVGLPAGTPAPEVLSPEDVFLEKASRSILAHLVDAKFGNEELARMMAMSESQLNRKLKALTGKTLSLFIRSVRLQQAKILLQTTHLNISEIAYAVGFADPAYFTRTFSQEFGGAPSGFRG